MVESSNVDFLLLTRATDLAGFLEGLNIQGIKLDISGVIRSPLDPLTRSHIDEILAKEFEIDLTTDGGIRIHLIDSIDGVLDIYIYN